ncbi:hypothetical protein [Streptomyces sp. NPDC005828]|uniref:hypothetical protein n=1 Tax=Streptomyces sp. NPDC005828 TaxID=3157071 RepID=UPI0033F61150
MTSRGGTGSIGLYRVDVAVHCAGARTVYDDDPVRMKVAEQLGAEVHDIHGKREKGFHLAALAFAVIDGTAVNQMAREPNHAGHQALAMVCDVTDEDQVAVVVDRTMETFSCLDMAYNEGDSISGWRRRGRPVVMRSCVGISGVSRRGTARPASGRAPLHRCQA